MNSLNTNKGNTTNNNSHSVPLYATVIIPLSLPENYIWQIPDSFLPDSKVGVRVEVELKNKKYAGIIKSISSEAPKSFKPKFILNILDTEPLIYEIQLQLWKWMANYYMCTEGDIMQAALPANLKLSSESVLIWNEDSEIDITSTNFLNDEEYILAEAIQLKKEIKISEAQKILDIINVYPVIKNLIDKKVCYVWEELRTKYKPKTDTFISLHATYKNEQNLEKLLNEWTKAPKQLELLLGYIHFSRTSGDVSQSMLLKKTNATAAQLKSLIDKNILVAKKKNINRIQSLPEQISIDFVLSHAQQEALQNIKHQFAKHHTCLLHGVTASGKTQIYIKLIEENVLQGKQVLYMLPEIALTTQITRRIQKHFGGYLAIYHSKFNSNERVELWNKVKNNEIKIVLGARSALFLPFKNIGLIIVDEEHDSSYKQQDPSPRYHARDTAIFYASLFSDKNLHTNAKVLLGSATPALETYFNALNNKYGLIELHERFANVALPSIELIDLKKQTITNTESKQQTLDNSKMALSDALLNAISKTLKNKKQVILFQNRRGYSPYMICNTCCWIPHCNHCDVTLTYHKSKNKLSCHYCASTYPIINTCVACGNHQFSNKNFGTEKIEEILTDHFPDAKIARMDVDTVKGKNAHDNLIKLFEQQRIDILVGTQMVVKGLDFEHVNLVGIIDADGLLNFTDYRVNERAFQLMEQVSGRAGRKDGVGTVFIQAKNTHHPVIEFVKQHNYKQLYHFEIDSRKLFNYPPFSRIIKLTFKHRESHFAEYAAQLMIKGLTHKFGNYLNGPAQPVVDRIRNLYLWEILIKLPKDTTLISQCKNEIKQQIAIIHNTKNLSGVIILPDVDPV